MRAPIRSNAWFGSASSRGSRQQYAFWARHGEVGANSCISRRKRAAQGSEDGVLEIVDVIFQALGQRGEVRKPVAVDVV